MKKWKIILLFVLISAVIGGILGYVFSGKEYNTATLEFDQAFDQYGVVSAREVLTDASSIWVEETVVTVLRYKEYLHSLFSEESDPIGITKLVINDNSYYQNLTTSEKKYFQALYAEVNRLMHEGGFANVDDWLSSIGKDDYTYANVIISDLTPVDNVVVVHSFSAKHLFVGMFIGAFAIIMLIVFQYVVSLTLKTVDDLKVAFALPVLGMVGDNKGTEIVASNILGVGKRAAVSTIALCGTIEDSNNESIKDELINRTYGESIKIIKEGSIISDSASVEAVTNSDAVILIEKIGLSKYEAIERE